MMLKRESYLSTNFKTRSDEGGKRFIEGYFIKYGVETELWEGFYELIEKEAVEKALDRNPDVRALFNHDSNICLGRTGNETLKLKSDDIGLFGVCEISNADPDAIGAHARIERQDVNGCSFGFFEFPAYPQTEISARKKSFEDYKKDALNARKELLKEKLKNGK